MPHHVDLHVGMRIRHCRWKAGMSKDRLGALTGLGPDDIRQCEEGEARLAPSELFAIAAALKVSPAFFFEGLEMEDAEDAEKRAVVLLEREALELVRAYFHLTPELRKGLVDVARTLRKAAG
jgi:transcriptional regulator with XRE-family HTH domain